MSQPAISNQSGVILTIGILAQGNRCALVMPVGTDSNLMTPVILCGAAVLAFKANVLPDLLDCMGSEAEVTYIQGEGMIDGQVPFRQDYPPATYTGTRGGGSLPASCGLLLSMYEDPVDVVAGHKIRVAHNTIPGQSPDDWTDGSPDLTIISNGDTIINTFVAGWNFDPSSGSDKWYRFLAATDRVVGTHIDRIATGQARGYVGTQRRRLVPH